MGGAAAVFKQSSDPGTSAVAGDLWSDTDNNALYRRNDDNDGWITLNSSEKADVTPETTVPLISSTIGDYTDPDSATASSYKDDANFTYNDGASTGFTTAGTAGKITFNTTDDQVDFTAAASSIDARAYAKDLGVDVTGNYCLDFEWEMTQSAYVSSGQACKCQVYLTAASLDPSGENPSGSWNGVQASGYPSGSYTYFYVQARSGGGTVAAAGDQSNTVFPMPSTTVTKRYIRMVRNGTTFTTTAYSDAARTTSVGSYNVTCNATDNLRYLAFKVFSQSTTNAWSFNVTNFKFYNGATTASENPPSYAIDDDTATWWQSNSEANPFIYVDVGSILNIGQMTIYPKDETTETEIKIQTSTDASAWTDVRKITYSNLTEGAYNYIRFNIQNARYVRIYGNSGESKVLAINEIKCQEFSDSEAADKHGHLPISATSTAIALNGT